MRFKCLKSASRNLPSFLVHPPQRWTHFFTGIYFSTEKLTEKVFLILSAPTPLLSCAELGLLLSATLQPTPLLWLARHEGSLGQRGTRTVWGEAAIDFSHAGSALFTPDTVAGPVDVEAASWGLLANALP